MSCVYSCSLEIFEKGMAFTIGSFGNNSAVPMMVFPLNVNGTVPILRHLNGIVPACTVATHGAIIMSIWSDFVRGVIITSVPSGKSVWATAMVSCIGLIVNLLSVVTECCCNEYMPGSAWLASFSSSCFFNSKMDSLVLITALYLLRNGLPRIPLNCPQFIMEKSSE